MKRDYIALWAILVSAFLLFLFFSTCDSPEIAGIRLKTSKMAESVFGKSVPDTVAATTNADASPRDSTETEPAPAEEENRQIVLDKSPKTILIIGDSMLEGLSMRLGAYCKAGGDTLYSAIWYSSTSELYGESHLITDYIRKYHPDFIFLSLGGNELFVSDVAEKRDKHIKSILAEIGDIPYLWIGPPNWKEDTGINELIRKNNPEGCFFSSTGLELDRKRDGAHPTPESAAAWMDSIICWMPVHGRYVLPLKQPVEQSARPYKLFIHQPGPLTDRP
ncbi:MAG: SGNH/GDSL hydrolase family protein [Muribaculaceae bacterium]|nr:SGNH/GDSL hydrolase family protein [Muribaculaceae bacterium]